MGIIDINVKIEVLKEGGAAGADILLTHVLMKVEQNRLNTYIEIVQKAFKKQPLIPSWYHREDEKEECGWTNLMGLTLHMYEYV